MQTFTCPNCGYESTYDPWVESAHCDECGYEPTAQGRRAAHHRHSKRETATYQPLLDELLAHWNDTHTLDLDFTLQTADQALAFFKDYQRMLGESPDALAGYVEFVRNYQPNRGEILAFVGAYLLLKQGNRAEAVRHLRALTMQQVPRSLDLADRHDRRSRRAQGVSGKGHDAELGASAGERRDGHLAGASLSYRTGQTVGAAGHDHQVPPVWWRVAL